MKAFADLNSILLINQNVQKVPIFQSAETEPRGILRNRINTTANHPEESYQPPTLSPKSSPTAATPPTISGPSRALPAEPRIQRPKISTMEKPNEQKRPQFRARSASVQSQKSQGNAATDDESNRNPALKEQPKKYIVAFGRTTKVDETIKNIRAPPPYKAPVGSIKDVMDLRKIVDQQASQLQSQQEEIQTLKNIIETQQQKYLYLLESNSKLWSAVNNLEKKFQSTSTTAGTTSKDSKKFDRAKEKVKENIVSNIQKPQPKDSCIIKKGKNVEREKSPKKKSENKESQLVPAAATVKPVHREIDAISSVQRFLQANPNNAKEIAQMAKNAQKKQQPELEEDRYEPRKSDHHHHRHNSVVEKITLERKIYKPPKAQDYFSSTIDDSLHKFGIETPTIQDRNHCQNRNRRPSPPTPRIREVTSSSSSQNDVIAEELNHQNRRGGGDRRTKKSSGDATAMPDRFDDDHMMSSDSEKSTPRRHDRYNRVANRLNSRRH